MRNCFLLCTIMERLLGNVVNPKGTFKPRLGQGESTLVVKRDRPVLLFSFFLPFRKEREQRAHEEKIHRCPHRERKRNRQQWLDARRWPRPWAPLFCGTHFIYISPCPRSSRVSHLAAKNFPADRGQNRKRRFNANWLGTGQKRELRGLSTPAIIGCPTFGLFKHRNGE